MNELPFMAEGPAGVRFLCCIPVHPARLRNDRHWQVSWLPDQRLAPPSQFENQWHMEVWLPGHSCGGSGGFEPPSLLGPTFAGQPMTWRFPNPAACRGQPFRHFLTA